jgi:hypothetical protein
MSDPPSDLRLAVEPLLALAGSVLSSTIGYSLAVLLLGDGKRAMVGLLIGALVFAVTASALAFLFARQYRSRGGSPWLVAAVVALPPAIMLLTTIH